MKINIKNLNKMIKKNISSRKLVGEDKTMVVFEFTDHDNNKLSLQYGMLLNDDVVERKLELWSIDYYNENEDTYVEFIFERNGKNKVFVEEIIKGKHSKDIKLKKLCKFDNLKLIK